MSEVFYRTTQAITEAELSSMVLLKEELPQGLQDFELAREGALDNETMASQGFPGGTTQGIRDTGRLAGYIREFTGPVRSRVPDEGDNVMAATVAHLFEEEDCVSRWMSERFLGEFQRFVGHDLEGGQRILSADQLQFAGFSDEAVGLRVLQTSQAGLVSSTIVDFRLGRLLGVVYLVAVGDVERKNLVSRMGMELERKMVRAVLGTI